MKKLKLKNIVPYLCVAQTGMLFIITLATLTTINNKSIIGCRMTSAETLICIQK